MGCRGRGILFILISVKLAARDPKWGHTCVFCYSQPSVQALVSCYRDCGVSTPQVRMILLVHDSSIAGSVETYMRVVRLAAGAKC
jgi:hypothetical protein